MRTMTDWDCEVAEGLEAPARYKISVDFIVRAASLEDAEEDIKSVVEYGILGMVDEEEREPIHAWDVSASESMDE